MLRGRFILPLIGAVAGGNAQASFLDDDFHCQTYGCVIVHDGENFDVYDNFNFATGGVVPPGGRMIRRVDAALPGLADVNPVVTGTLSPGDDAFPGEGEGALLGFDGNSNPNDPVDVLPSNDTNGLLDAGDVFGPVELRRNTSIGLVENEFERSFFITSTTDFFLGARVVVSGQGDLADPSSLENTALEYRTRTRGSDGGLRFGRDARRGGFRRLGSFRSLDDLFGSTRLIAEFRRDIRRRASDSLADQSIRFDYVYGFETYDLSLGSGELNYTIEFDVFNR